MSERQILFFDTETTGLIDFKNPDLEVQPHIVQIGYIFAVYDTETYQLQIIDQRNITCNPGVPIPEEASKVHGITDEMASKHPSFWSQAKEFIGYTIDADIIVCHNTAFDFQLVKIEARRVWEDEVRREAWFEQIKKKMLCTMQSTVKLCQVPFPSGKAGYKWPKLQELHKFLFDKEFDNAHDAYADIKATADCFVELHKRNHITIV